MIFLQNCSLPISIKCHWMMTIIQSFNNDLYQEPSKQQFYPNALVWNEITKFIEYFAELKFREQSSSDSFACSKKVLYWFLNWKYLKVSNKLIVLYSYWFILITYCFRLKNGLFHASLFSAMAFIWIVDKITLFYYRKHTNM